MKKFTSKPIKLKNNIIEDKKKNEVDEKFEDFYENAKPLNIEKPQRIKGIWGLVILVSILFGFSSGFIYNFYFNYNSIPEINGNQKIIVEKQQDITVTSDERLQELVQDINPIVVNFYNNSTEVNGPYYQDIYSFGNGFVLTSDGWIITTDEVFNNIGENNYLILTADYKSYTATKILKDPTSPIVFVKIDATDLTVAKIANLNDVVTGQKAFGLIANYPQMKVASLHLADLQASNLDDVVASSEKLSHFISAREGYNKSLIGSPIVSLNGEIIAIINGQNFAIPINYIKASINTLTKKEQIERVNFGVHYISLSKYPKINPETGEMRNRGALLSGFNDLTAVIKNSPADKAGLKVGDIILQVENELVNGNKSLTQIIQEYSSGDTIKLIILRNGKEKIVDVKLTAIEE